MAKAVVIIGASGHGKVIADIIQKYGDIIKGFLDDSKEPNDMIIGFPVLGKVIEYEKYLECQFVIAIGNAAVREKISLQLENKVQWYTAIHPTAIISEFDVEIGAGTVVMAAAVINSSAKIGKHCIVNTGAIVEHDNVLCDYVHISPNATLAGTVKIGKSTHIGAGAVVRNNLEICSDCVIGVGAAVVKNIAVPGYYAGVPAERIKA